MIYTIYNEVGQILRIVNTTNIASQLGEADKYLVGEYRDDKFYIDETDTPTELPPKPGPEYVFDYTQKQWINPLSNEEQVAQAQAKVLAKRKRLLIQSDWTQLPDVPLTTKQSWAAYRQALRDITTQSGYPTNVTWPEAPQA